MSRFLCAFCCGCGRWFSCMLRCKDVVETGSVQERIDRFQFYTHFQEKKSQPRSSMECPFIAREISVAKSIYPKTLFFLSLTSSSSMHWSLLFAALVISQYYGRFHLIFLLNNKIIKTTIASTRRLRKYWSYSATLKCQLSRARTRNFSATFHTLLTANSLIKLFAFFVLHETWVLPVYLNYARRIAAAALSCTEYFNCMADRRNKSFSLLAQLRSTEAHETRETIKICT